MVQKASHSQAVTHTQRRQRNQKQYVSPVGEWGGAMILVRESNKQEYLLVSSCQLFIHLKPFKF